MTALLELKQRIKNFYGQYEMYFQPLLKFILGLVYFLWINQSMGYMAELDNIFIVLILALICSILPSAVMVFAGCVLMVGHCYALGIDVAAFMLVLILFMMILFLRFSSGKNIVMVLTPLSFAANLPVLLPIGSGLLSSAISAFPAGCGVIIYYFISFLRANAQTFQGSDMEVMERLTMMADGMVANREMWITVIAFIGVILLVNLIRTRSFDYAWRIAIVVGGVTYVLIMLGGGFYFGVQIEVVPLIIYTVVTVLIGIVLEFFVFGGDYTRTERLEYEDDEYYYYVKAVPKAAVTTSERNIKKINGSSSREERRAEESVVSFSEPIFQGEERPRKAKKRKAEDEMPVMRNNDIDDIDFEKKLEESLRDL
ncbi:MAG: hypothetical protein Q4C77_06780 [Eubacteriales bacterium]|nr:hypothetical protein [Eubacteriales bacterium]